MSEEEPQHAAPAGSPVAGLKNRVAKARKVRYFYRPIPGFDPPASVRYGVLEPDEIDAIRKRRKKLPDLQGNKAISADLCIAACQGIFDEVDGKFVSINPKDRERCYVNDDGEIVGEPVKFGDPRLAELLGIEEGNAASEVFNLYPYEGDVIGAADAIMRFSVEGDADEIEQMIRGNS